ncbi:MAG: CxxxxCH/CxxCH domain-containing protein [Deltaproteobacteria bacterium]|nr:CxxxxCH/CxxCH domain-containing protein [Deltaproteobacteria bacterium]
MRNRPPFRCLRLADPGAAGPPAGVSRHPLRWALTVSTLLALFLGSAAAQTVHEYYTAQGLACEQCHPCGARPWAHTASWMDQAATGFHAAAANQGLGACQGCHGANLDGVGGSTTVACAQCHGSAWKADCVFCHGGADNPTGAPPKATWSGVSDPIRTGTHTSHVAAPHGLAQPVGCVACHSVPADAMAPKHIDGGTAEVTLLGVGGLPAWDRASATCANTYCHGATLQGGTQRTPVWTRNDGSQRTCTSCHGAPPPAPHTSGTSCGSCHPGYSQTAVNVATHLNGALEASGQHPSGWAAKNQHGYSVNTTGLGGCKSCHGSDLQGGSTGVSCASCHATAGFSNWDTNCTFCHGNRATGRQSPPLDTQGRNLATNVSVGRHDTHVAATLANAIACTQCHPARSASVVTDADHVDGNGTAEVTFGGLARTGSVTPTYTRSSATSASCASTYCHGNFSGGSTATVTWTSSATSTCTSCHGNPPATGEHSKHVSGEGIACSTCHGTGYARTGTSTGTVAKATHVDGLKALVTNLGWSSTARTCAPSCHSRESW